MSNIKYFSVTSIFCVLVILLNRYHFDYTGNIIGSMIGYFASLVLLPIIFSTISASVLVYLKPAFFGFKRKIGLFFIPMFCLVIDLVFFYQVAGYGGVH